VADHNDSARDQHAARLGRRAGTLKPVPALSGRVHVDRPIVETRLLRAGDPVLDVDPCLRIELPRLHHQLLGWIDADHLAAVQRKAAGDCARAGADVDDTLALSTDALPAEALEHAARKARSMTCVVGRGASEVDRHGLSMPRAGAVLR
jgi:hypothetical protein